MTNKITSKDVAGIRSKLKMTRREFALEMEITETTVYLWEKSEKNIRLHPGNVSKLTKMQKMAERLGAAA